MSPLRRGLLALVTVAVLWPAGNAVAAPPAGSGNAATPAAGDPASFASGLELPAAAGALAPNLRPGGLLSWLEPVATSTGSGHRLLFARPRGDGWAPPQPVVEGTDFFANWADLPAVVELPGGGLVASWLAQAGEDPYAYGIRLAVSKDGGESFAPVGWLHRDRSENEHGFVSLVPRRDAGAWAFWLDGGALDTGGAMQLHTATVLGPSGDTVTGEEVLDPRVCECCTTSAARTADGPVVVYRGRTESEIRDIRIVRRTGEGWSEPKTVADDAWRVSGCPVNGPAIDADGRRVVVAWFTGGEPGPRVRVAFSKDGGASFGRPFDVDSENPRGRVDVALLADGDAVVSWLGRGDEGSEVRLRRV
ncbi:MAG: exo-alpha-sialidase, partial [Acidobacteria bacterium]|nr:exo-alpha-sialidase [Acidobacteriota bacterium]